MGLFMLNQIDSGERLVRVRQIQRELARGKKVPLCPSCENEVACRRGEGGEESAGNPGFELRLHGGRRRREKEKEKGRR